MNVLLVFTYGKTLEGWHNKGIIFREIALYKKLVEKKVKCSFLTFGDEQDFKYSDILGEIKVVPTYEFIKSRFFILKIIKSLFLPFKLKSLFKDADIIKTVQVYGSWILCIAKIFYNRKIVIRAGYQYLNAFKVRSSKKGIKNLVRYIVGYFFIFIFEFIAYKLADGIILTSDYDIPYIVKQYKLKKKFNNNKIRLFYNFIDIELFRPISVEKKDKYVLFIGNLHRGKNVVNLVNAFKDLEGFNLDIIGNGPDEEMLKKIVKENNINVNFLGLFPNNELPEILNHYQIFLLPSIAEGNPKVLLEAMSCGIACVGSNIRGINNIINHKQNGVLCETDSQSIRNTILELYNNEALRFKIGKNARKFILENCSLNLITEKEYSFYQELLK